MRMPLACFAFSVVLGLVVAGGASGKTPSRDAKLRASLATLVSTANAPGGVLLVQTPVTTWSGATGLAQIKPQRKMVATARFRVASVTKIFTAALVLRLVADGRVSLDDTVERWLPGRLPNGAGSSITIRRLLGHTSGLIDEAPEWVGGPPGSFYYANRNYVLLGEIVAAASGSTFESQLSQQILVPLGLTGTQYTTPTSVARGIAHGYTKSRPRIDVTSIPETGPHVGLVSRATDLVRFERGLFAGRVIPRELVTTMQTPAPVGALAARGYDAYGLGLMRFPAKCGPAWGHRGIVAGYTSWLLWTPDGKRAVVALLNVGHALGDFRVLSNLSRLVTAALCS